MNTISELLNSYTEITKTAAQRPGPKVAFVANPAPPQPQAQPQAPAQPAGPPPAPAMMPEVAAPQPGAPQPQAPQQAAAPAQAGGGLMDQVLTLLQQLPPQVQQQVAPALQQIQSLPPDQRDQQLAQILQELSPGAQGQAAPQQPPAQPAPEAMPPQAAPAQPGMVAQAAEEDMYGGVGLDSIPPELIQQYMQQQGGEDPSAQQDPMMAQDPSAQAEAPAPAQQDPVEEDAANAEASAVEAKNELDNVKVTLSVRELLDLVGKGSATASLLKVKQLADTHKQKMEQTRQKAETQQQQQAQQGQTDQQGMMNSGGIYPTPMGG